MLSLFILFASQPQSDAVNRFANYMKEAKSLSANLDFTLSDSPAAGKGSIHIRRPNRLLFKMKWGVSDYSFCIGEKENVAIERGTKVYREYGNVGRMFIPDTDISGTPQYSLPIALLAGDLGALVPKGVTFHDTGKTTINGVSADTVHAEFQIQMGKVLVNAAIDSAGRALQIEQIYEGGPSGSLTSRIKISDYKVNPNLGEEFFDTPVPAGYRAQTVAANSYPLNVGEKMPLEGWTPLKSGSEMAALGANKPLFVAISDPDCDVSKAAEKTVTELASSIQAKGGVAVAISVNSSSGQEPVYKSLPYFVDRTEKLIDKLRAPGTPMFLLVSSKGIVTRVWYGFDSAQAEAFKKDVLEWVGKPPKPQE